MKYSWFWTVEMSVSTLCHTKMVHSSAPATYPSSVTILHQIQGLTDKLEWRPSNNSSTTLIKSTYPWSLDFLPDVISTTSFVSVRWCKGNHFLLWNRRILKTCLSTLHVPMTLSCYNNAKECFVMTELC